MKRNSKGGSAGSNEDEPKTMRIAMNAMVLLLLAAVCYWKLPLVRSFVDARVPATKSATARFFPAAQPVAAVSAPAEPAPSEPVTPVEPPAPSAPPPEPEVAEVPAPVTKAPPDMHSLAADRSAWPKKLVLRKATQFPAVVGGKVVGKIIAPAGSEAKVVVIQEAHIGVEYHGGGAWVAPTDTNLLEIATAH